MTITTTLSYVTYLGNGSTAAFPFSFPVQNAGQLVVTITNTNVSPVTVTTLNTTQYSVANGTVTLSAPLAAGQTLCIRRIVPYCQDTSIINQGGFYPDVLEESLDYLTMEVQQLAEQASRTIAVPVGSNLDPTSYLTTVQTAANTATNAAATAVSSASSASLQAANAALAASTALSAMSTTLAALATTQIALMTMVTANLPSLTALSADLSHLNAVALLTTQINALNTTQIAALNTSQIAALANDLTQLNSINTSQINALNTAQIAMLGSTTTLGTMTTVIANLTAIQNAASNASAAAAWATAAAASAANLPNGPAIGTGNVPEWNGSAWVGVPPSGNGNVSNAGTSIAGHVAQFSDSTGKNITDSGICIGGTTGLAQLSGGQIQSTNLLSLNSTQIGMLGTSQIAGLASVPISSTQWSGLTQAPNLAFTATQIASITQIPNLTQTTILTTTQLVSLSTTAVSALTVTQVNALALASTAALQQELYTFATAGGTSDALTASFTPAITPTTLALGATEVTVQALYANATNTPTFTPNSGVVPAAAIVKGNNQSLVPGDIASHLITLQWSAVWSKWVLLNPAYGVTPSSTSLGAALNLNISIPNASATANIYADEITVKSQLGGSPLTIGGLFDALNLGTTGPGGMDTGAAPASSFVNLYAILAPGATADANTLCYFQFNGNATDSSQFGNVLTVNGTPSYGSSGTPKIVGQQYVTVGAGKYFSIAAPANWGVGTGNFTIEFDFNVSALPTGFSPDEGVIFTVGTLQIWINGSGNLGYYNGTNYTTTAVVSTNTWYAFAATRNNGVTVFYLNGANVFSVADTAIIAGGGTAYIGCTGGTYNFSGSLQNFRFSNICRQFAAYTPLTVPFALTGSGKIAVIATTQCNTPIYTGANMPSGYTSSALIATLPTNSSSQFQPGIALNRTWYWQTKQNLANITSSPSTTYAAITTTTCFPVNAKTIGGVGGAPTSVAAAFAMSADASGTGELVIIDANTSLLVDNFDDAEPFSNFPIVTAQTVYYKSYSTSYTVRIDIDSYTI